MQNQASVLKRFFHPVLPSIKLRKKPVAVEIASAKIVLFRDAQGAAVAVEDRCPHRFTPLSLGRVEAGKLACGYHGWRVNRNGDVEHPTEGPIKNCSIKSYSAYERAGFVWIASNPLAHQPPLPGSEWFKIDSYTIDIAAPHHIVFDNFSEDEHFPYVHKVLGWDKEGARDVQYRFQAFAERLEVSYWGPQRRFPGMRLLMAKPGDYFRNDWVTEFNPVRTAYTTSICNSAGERTSPFSQRGELYFVPASDRRTLIQVMHFAKFDDPKWNWVFRLNRRILARLGEWDLSFDKELTEKLADIPYSLKGMRLGKYDQPIFHGRRLLESIYLGGGVEADRPANGLTDEAITL